MKCKNCDGSGIDMFESECRFCGGMGVVEPLTEQEYMQTCNTEQLAEFIAETINTNPCGYPLSCNECGLIDRCREDEHPSSKEAWVEWLKQPHKE